MHGWDEKALGMHYFVSCTRIKWGRVAKWIMRRASNPKIAGSSPVTIGAFYFFSFRTFTKNFPAAQIMFKHKNDHKKCHDWHIFCALNAFFSSFYITCKFEKLTTHVSIFITSLLSFVQSPTVLWHERKLSGSWSSFKTLNFHHFFDSLKILPPRHPITLWSALKRTAMRVRFRQLLFIDLQFISPYFLAQTFFN